MIVTAPCIASCDIAISLTELGIIVGRQNWVKQIDQTVRQNSYDNRLTGFYPVDLRVERFQKGDDLSERKVSRKLQGKNEI